MLHDVVHPAPAALHGLFASRLPTDWSTGDNSDDPTTLVLGGIAALLVLGLILYFALGNAE